MRDVRSCLLAIELFGNVDDLMNFVEQAMKNDQNEVPAYPSDSKSKYRVFLKLPIKSNSTISQNVSCLVFETYRMLLSIPKVHAMFNAEKYRRFLMHLIGLHFWIAEHNSEFCRVKLPQKVNGSDRYDLSTQTGLIKKYLKHSCVPNAMISTYNGNTVIITVRPVKKDQQIVCSYLMTLLEPKKKRHHVLGYLHRQRNSNSWPWIQIFNTFYQTPLR